MNTRPGTYDMNRRLVSPRASSIELLAKCRPFSALGDNLFDGKLRIEQIVSAATNFDSIPGYPVRLPQIT